MEWQNGRQLSRATTERDSTTEDVLDFAYDANGIRTSKTVTRNTYRPVQTYKVTFVADGKTVKTMNVTEGYTLKDSDYPAVPEKAGYTGAWQRYPSPVQSNVTVSATYTKITTYYTVTFVADGFTVKTMQVYSGYKLKDSDYPSVPEKLRYEGTWQKYTAAVTSNVTVQATYRKMLPLLVRFYADETLVKTMQVDYGYRLNDLDYPDVPPKTGFTGSWRKYTQRITSDQIIRANYMPIGIIDPVLPSTVDSEPTEEPWEPIEPNAAPAEEPDIEEQDLSQSDWTLASTETVTHEYLTQSGKVVRETITTSMDAATRIGDRQTLSGSEMTYYTQIMLMPLKGGALLHIVSNQEYTEYKGDWNMQSIETYGEDYNPRAPEAKYCQYFWLPNSEMPEEYTLMGQGSQTDFTLGLADMGYPKY